MYNKRLTHAVRVSGSHDTPGPTPRPEKLVFEQFGGPQGQLAAAMCYFTQAMSEDDAGRGDMLFDITTKEVSHLEIIGDIFCTLNKGIKGKMPEGREKAADLLVEFTRGAKATPLPSYAAEVGGGW